MESRQNFHRMTTGLVNTKKKGQTPHIVAYAWSKLKQDIIC